MTIKFLEKSEKEQILKKLNMQFGISKISGKLIRIGKDRIFLYTGSFTEEQVKQIIELTNIERIGIYLGRIIEETDEFRLSIAGTQIFKDQITKNIYELDKNETEKWIKGERIIPNKSELQVIRYNEDFLGCGNS